MTTVLPWDQPILVEAAVAISCVAIADSCVPAAEVLSRFCRIVCPVAAVSVVLVNMAAPTSQALFVRVVIATGIEAVDAADENVDAVASGACCLAPERATAPTTTFLFVEPNVPSTV